MTGRILIADGTADHRIALRAMLGAARYVVETADNADDALEAARGGQIDLILADPALSMGASRPLVACLRMDPRTARIPVIVLTSPAGAATDRIAALRAGADDVTPRPGAAAALLARIRSHLRAADMTEALGQRDATLRGLGLAEPIDEFRAAARIALIAHDTARVEQWRSRLAPHIPHPLTAYGIRDALSEADRKIAADLFVIEAQYAHPSEALRMLADLRARPRTRHAAIVLVHEDGDVETATNALDMGASDLLPTAFDPEELALRIDIQLARKRAGDRLRASVDERLRLAMEDPLTGLFNRRYALAHADGQAERGFCVILADIDRFKSINDTYGHGAGDAVLREVARRLKDNVRSMDLVARIGGEEFLIFLPDPDASAAQTAARRLCAQIHDRPVDLPDDGPKIAVTASFGVAMGDPGDSVGATIDRADKALYQAKAAGRDTVTMAASCAA